MNANDKETAWLAKAEACSALKMSLECFQRSIRPHLQEDAIRRAGNQWRYRLDAVVEADVERRLRAKRKAPRPPAVLTEDEALFAAAPDGDELREWRRWKAALARQEYERKAKTVLPRADVEACLALAHGGIRSLIERWERKHRESEARELRAAVQQGITALEAVMERDDDDD